MTITQNEIELVTTTFAKVAPIADQAAELFYGRLFEIDPTTPPLFEDTDMTEQGKKLMQMLSVAVGSLGKLDALIPQVEALGARHINYGVTKDQYGTVGAALLWTLEQGLGDAFTDDVKAAWTTVYTTLADVATSAYDT